MQCEHVCCHCEVPDGERWCSPQCRDSPGRTGGDRTCPCGHAECEQETG